MTFTKKERGINPKTLIELVKNTAPWIYHPDFAAGSVPKYIEILRNAHDFSDLNDHEYFELCLAAHWATVATFVPTDVDNAIRVKLWANPEIHLAASGSVLQAKKWNWTHVSQRFAKSPVTGELLSGHDGEWFSVAVGAYCALSKTWPDRAKEMLERILAEVIREGQIMKDLHDAGDRKGVLIASYLIAHNLGDLDRVMDLWQLNSTDRLRELAYKAGHDQGATPENHRYLKFAGILNKAYMAAENHRHFPLRTVKFLRESQDFLLPSGPFFDDWGSMIVKHPLVKPEQVAELAGTLVDGLERLPRGTVGYSRALVGILETFQGGLTKLELYLPAASSKLFRTGHIRDLCSVPRKQFEDRWYKLVDKTQLP